MTEKKRILYIITQSNMGGAQKYVFDLATGLNKEKYEVAVAAGGEGELFTRLEAAEIKVFRLKRLRRQICTIWDTLAYFEIKKLLKTWQPDVLHLNSSKPSVLGALTARNLSIKVVYTVHGAVFEASFSWLAKKIFLWIEKFFGRYKQKIICVSENDRRLWLKYRVLPEQKLVTIHNGIVPNLEFLPKEEARKKLFEKYSSPLFGKEGLGRSDSESLQTRTREIYLVGFTGYFYPEKNLETLIDAANLIFTLPQTKVKNIIFVLIGTGPLDNNLKQKVKNSKVEDKIMFPGAIPESWRYLKAFDVFVFPSKKEGLPYAILEAMQAGVPIVASDVGGIPEIIEDNVNGFLIKSNDHEALAEKILQILENPALAQKFSAASRQKLKEFSLQKMIEATEAQY